VLVDVLANDTPGSGTIAPATLAITAAPSKGTAVVDSGQARYTANGGTSGSDTFSYTVTDNHGDAATAVVTMTITENRAPTGDRRQLRHRRRCDAAPARARGAEQRHRPRHRRQAAGPSGARGDERPAAAQRHRGVHLHPERSGRRHLRVPRRRLHRGGLKRRHGHHLRHRTARAAERRQRPLPGTDRPRARRPRAGRDGRRLQPEPAPHAHRLLQGDVSKGTLLLRGDGSFTYTPKAG
jgi:hypothetical protein